MDGSELGDLGSRMDHNVNGPSAISTLRNRRRSPRDGAAALGVNGGENETAENRDVLEMEDLEIGFQSFSTPFIGTRPTYSRGGEDHSKTPSLEDMPLPELELPAPALPTPPLTRYDSSILRTPARGLSMGDRRAFAKSSQARSPTRSNNNHNNNHNNYNNTHNNNTPSSPKTRFDLTGSPPGPSGVPLRPILTNPVQAFSPKLGKEVHDITDEHPDHHAVPASPGSPAFAPREDDEPHPERTIHEGRTPHPLYTPVTLRKRRRQRRKARSIASGRTNRSAKSSKSRLTSAWRNLRRRRRRSRHNRDDDQTESSSSSSSTSSSSTGKTGDSSRSSSTWAGWRFWRNSSSGGSSDSDDDSDSDWEPPAPHFTLLTPCLARPGADMAYPAHLLPSNAALKFSHATATSKESPNNAVFDLTTTTTIGPALERLKQFWQERQQEDCLAGDIGAGASAVAPDQEEVSYFSSHLKVGSNANTPAATPGVQGGPSSGIKKLKGEARAAKAEEQRLGKNRNEDGPAWWLDVMCPTVTDMRELRKVLPLHPLTMEDILHQETREKIESFNALGYYFVVFRALDESYFKYTHAIPTPATSTENIDELNDWKGGNSTADNRQDNEADKRSVKGGASQGFSSGQPVGRRGRVDIVEGVGGKEGVEGVGVGAVNLYLVVFGDGILSFHFEEITKHVERVQGKLQQFGLSRHLSSHWIAYGLMDSIVDAFFPLIDFIEGESDEVDTFLSDPLNSARSRSERGLHSNANSPNIGLDGVQELYDEDIIGIVVEDNLVDEAYASSGEKRRTLKKATILRSSRSFVLRGLALLPVPQVLLPLIPPKWIKSQPAKTRATILVDSDGYKVYPLSELGSKKRAASAPLLGSSKLNNPFDRATMLKRIADTRKLVTGLSRLLGPKTDVVRGLRKRTQEEHLRMFRSSDSKHDISIYLGDLYDHIIAMQQSLGFYDVILSHDHPAYLGILRLALVGTKAGTDAALVKLYIVTLTLLPINILTGLFSMNAKVPHNGDRSTHRLEGPGGPGTGAIASHTAFYGVIGGVVFVALCVWGTIWLIFKTSRRKFKKRGPIAGMS